MTDPYRNDGTEDRRLSCGHALTLATLHFVCECGATACCACAVKWFGPKQRHHEFVAVGVCSEECRAVNEVRVALERLVE